MKIYLCFSRILSLIAHYEAGKDEHLETDLEKRLQVLNQNE